MAANPNEGTESTKECLAKIDKIIEGALGNDSSRTYSRSTKLGETKAIGDFSPASPDRKTTTDMSKIVFSPVRENYSRSSNSLSGLANGERCNLETQTLRKDSFLNNKGSNYTSMSDMSDNWVNYQFERLVTDKKNNPTFKAANEVSNNISQGVKSKNIDEILREYSSPGTSRVNNSHYPVYQPLGMPSLRTSGLVRVGSLNRSLNNETFDAQNPEIDHVRRVGSSVDGEVGDMLKTFGAKCSLSGTRCSTTDTEENTSIRMSRDSEVDLMPQPKPPRMEFNEIRSDLSDLNYSFQRERERLRHLETLIRKAPSSGFKSQPESSLALRSHNYSSRFLNEFSGKRAYSVTDYSSKYAGSDWKPSSPTANYLGRASSSMSYKNLGVYSPTRTNYTSDLTSTQLTPSGFDSNRVPSTSSHRLESRESETDPMNHSSYNYNNYPKSTASGNASRTTLNRSYNAKKDKNMSKSLTENYSQKSNNSLTKSFSKNNPSNFGTRRYLGNQDCHFEKRRSNNKNLNKAISSKSSMFDMLHENSRKNVTSKSKQSRYQPYQPYLTEEGRYHPKCTKSEFSNVDIAPGTNQFSRLYDTQKVKEWNAPNHRWTSALCSSYSASHLEQDNESKSPSEEIEERKCECEQPGSTRTKRGKIRLRSKSACRVPNNNNVSAWAMQHRDQFSCGNHVQQINEASFLGKKSGRKLKPKVKKGITAGTKQKKNTTKRK